MTPQEELKTIDDAIALATARKAEIEKELEKHKYPEGAPGYLFNDDTHRNSLANLIYTDNPNLPYSGKSMNGGFRYGDYKNFAPLETCIMGMRYENTGVYPGHSDDGVMVELTAGRKVFGEAWKFKWGYTGSSTNIVSYYIIKRYEG